MNKTAAIIAIVSLAYAFIYIIFLVTGVNFPAFFDGLAILAVAYVGIYGAITTTNPEAQVA